MRDHTEIEELLALEALGGLEPEDRARLDALLAEHGHDCAECAELREAFAETASMLGAGLEPATVSADLEDRTVAEAMATRPSAGDGGPAAIAPAPRRRTALVAIAAAIVLVAVGALGGYLAAPRNSEQPSLNQNVRIVQFAPSDGTDGSMTLAVAPDGTNGYVFGSGLAAPPDGETYELWTIHGDAPTSLGCVVPSDGQIVVPVSGAFATADVAAVTVEPSACPGAPTTSPVMVATL
ncbi:MAG TPA: anti-sigma factor [Actinomycetota bacterium]|jgi:anti-sigma-K factor RskA|nr:anti-sigma factor [Actinomycetota bacterium]